LAVLIIGGSAGWSKAPRRISVIYDRVDAKQVWFQLCRRRSLQLLSAAGQRGYEFHFELGGAAVNPSVAHAMQSMLIENVGLSGSDSFHRIFLNLDRLE
jgi:hypothetical protein